MEHSTTYNCRILSDLEARSVQGGIGPIGEAIEWYYKTVGSFYRGLWDGLSGNEPAV